MICMKCLGMPLQEAKVAASSKGAARVMHGEMPDKESTGSSGGTRIMVKCQSSSDISLLNGRGRGCLRWVPHWEHLSNIWQ